MELFEYQAKSFLSRFAIPFSPYFLMQHEEESGALFEKYGLTKGTVKVEWIDEQSVKGEETALYSSEETFLKAVADIFQKKNGVKDRAYSHVMVLPFVDIDQEMSLRISCNRRTAKIEIELSTMHLGEMKIVQETVLQNKRLYDFQKMSLFVGLHLPERFQEQFFSVLDGLLALYYSYDIVSLQVRPLAIVYNGGLEVTNIQLIVDDNASFRQQEERYFFEKGQFPPLLTLAHRYGFSIQRLPGSIGCIVTGRALLEATMDLLIERGGRPGLAIDIGQEAEDATIQVALQCLVEEKNSKVLLVHLFGGFKDSVSFIRVLVKAIQDGLCSVPIVVRMEVISLTSVQELLAQSHVKIQCTESFDEAVCWSVERQGGQKHAHIGR